ncbi:putative oxygen-independent coproporphyrinogen III oxidase, partial [Chlamydia psittaci C1/97]
QNSRILP